MEEANTGSASAHANAKVAALIPAFNPGESLRPTLESICTQPVACEVFVVDDGSQPPITLPRTLHGKPLHLIRLDPNQGITAALNAGLEQILDAGFDYISRHDCGDLDHADRLGKQLDFLEKNENVMLVGSSVSFNSADGRVQFFFKAPTSRSDVIRKMRYSAAIVHSSCVFRAEVFRKIDLYSRRYAHAEDYELFFRILQRFEVSNIADVLVAASYNTEGISIKHRHRSLSSRLKIQLLHFDPVSVHSYLGVLQTLLLNVVPYSLVSRIKSLRPAPASR